MHLVILVAIRYEFFGREILLLTNTTPDKSFLIFLGALCFSISGTIQALAPDGATPYVIAAVRMLVGGLLLFVWCFASKKLIRGGSWPLSNLIISVIALVSFQVCFFSGVLEVGVAVGTMISIGVAPVAVAALGFVILKEVPQRSWYVSTVVAIIGLVLLNFTTTQEPSLSGIILPVVAGLSYACYFVFSKALVADNPPELVIMVLSLASATCLLPVYFIFPVEWILTARGLIVSFSLGLVTLAIAYSLLLAGQKHTKVSTAATLSLAEPFGAACFGILFLGEQINTTTITGMFCIFASVLLLIYLPSKAYRS